MPFYRSLYPGGIARARAGTQLSLRSCRIFARNLSCIVLLANAALVALSSAQVAFVTGHSDNARTAANVNETLLTPGNVNKNSFGRLFSQPVDYQVLGQPLYVPNVNIPGRGTHNVVFVVTMLDSVYAFDADDNSGANAQPLWQVNFTDPANGITVASYSTHTLPCTNANSTGPGFNQEGIVSTPVIDVTSGTMYVVAKTVENGTVRHRLHALDITNGHEKFGGSVVISATSTSNKGHVTNFNSLHQKNRPGLLLLNGAVYIGFGSNYCNDGNSGWVIGYDATTLQQIGAFNTNPDHGLTSIWQSGQGLAADDQNIYFETGEGNFDVDVGGQGFTDSVLKLSTNPLALADYFIPWNVVFLNGNDLDLSSTGPIILPDQDGPFPHVAIASGKQGTIYVLNRDNMGLYGVSNNQILQEIPLAVGEMFSSPAYWNSLVYFCGNAGPLRAFAVSSGQLSNAPVATTAQKLVGAHSPSLSANGNTNGVIWVINGGQLWAFDAVTLQLLYNTKQILTRDQLPQVAHFATQTVANGKVYIATRTSLEVYGLFHLLNVTGGNNQSAPILTALPLPVQVQAVHAYTGVPLPGVAVAFSDGGKGGTFNPASAVTDAGGFAATTYTFPQKSGTYTLTISAQNFGSVTATETALPGPPTLMITAGGNQQTGAAGSVLPVPLTAKVQDAYKNGVPGITVTFNDQGKGGVLTPPSAVTDSAGKVRVSYQLPTLSAKYIVKASASGLKTLNFTEFAVAGPPANAAVVSGNNQSASAGSPLPQPLVVKVTDQYGNPVPGAAVTFDDQDAGGQFGNLNPVTTDSTGTASQLYTLPPVAGSVTITASVAGVANPAVFTETAQ
jgi:Bacterial Ig-like domain (group 1)/Invasin, domain 3